MRNKIVGGIGMLWGGAILANQILGGPSDESEAYQVGQTVAMVFGGLMFVVGAYYLFKKSGNSQGARADEERE